MPLCVAMPMRGGLCRSGRLGTAVLLVLILIVTAAAHERADLPNALVHGRQLLAEAGGTPKPYKGPSEYKIRLYTIHGWLMGVAWGALAPAGILVAYKFRNLPSRGLWFQIHRALMALAYIMQLTGVAVVSVSISEWGISKYPRQSTIHLINGLVLQCLAFIQVVTAFTGRPSLSSRYRRIWNAAHWRNGRLLLLYGTGLIFDGLLLYRSGPKDQWKFIALSAYLFALLMVAAGKDTFEQIKLPPPATMSGAQPGKESAIDLAKAAQAKQAQAGDPHASPRISARPQV